MRLVLLALLDRAVGGLEIFVALEALDDLLREVAVRHRVAEDGDALAVVPEELGDAPGRLALARARTHGADRRHGLRRRDHRVVRGEELEARAGSERLRSDMQHVLVGHVRVREDDLVHLVLADQLLELRFRVDRNPVRVELARQERGIDTPCDVRDLRGGEGDDLELFAPAVDHVEVVEVTPGRTGDQDPRPHV